MTRNERGRNDDASNPGSDNVLSRLNERRLDGESEIDVVERLLDETVKQVPLRTVIDDIIDHVDHLAGIDIHLLDPEDPTSMEINVATVDADGYEDTFAIYDAVEQEAIIQVENGDEFAIPFFIVATTSGPASFDTIQTTRIYIGDSVAGADPRSVDEGLEMFRQKLGKSPQDVRSLLQN